MLVSDFDYDLPEELIAQHPPAVRGSSRMMTLDRRSGDFADHLFADLPSLLAPGDLLILNDSRVVPARLYATREGLTTQRKSPSPSGLIEVLLTEHLSSGSHNDWSALVRPAKKVHPGETLLFHAPDHTRGSQGTNWPLERNESGAPSSPAVSSPAKVGSPNPAPPPLLTATVLSAGDFGERTLRFEPVPDFHTTLERIGHLPLPPYIHRPRNTPDTAEDRDRYQTVYSSPFAQRAPNSTAYSLLFTPSLQGSAAAPTAGLHFTPEILTQIQQRGVEIARITLHVGLGTFQPVRARRTEDIRLHAEPYTLPETTASALNRAKKDHRRIIAVGTTTTRTLEHIARESERSGQPIAAHSGSTSLFLSPGLDDDFKLVSGLLTNFHLPQSTLLMLVSAFAGALTPDPDAGREAVLAAYAHAIAEHYRFFSYGDCMLIT